MKRLPGSSAVGGALMVLVAALMCRPGNVAAQPKVTPGGALSYSINFQMPPGSGSLVPPLGLTSSGSASSIAGVGWSLQGISVITRCDADFVVDGGHHGVNFDVKDKLCLDGERLLSLDPSTGNPQTGVTLQDAQEVPAGQYHEYRTQKDTYARIRAYGAASGYAGSGPAYFKVWTKSGQVYEYGASPSSDGNTRALILKYAPPSQPRTFGQAWAVSRISDPFGNHIDFKYVQRDVAWGSSGTYQTGHEWYLGEVQYGGNKVLLNYDDRPTTSPQDGAEAYHLGSKSVTLKRLSSVTTYVNSPNTTVLGAAATAVAVKTYKLSYDNGPVTGRSRLTAAQECAGGPSSTKCLPATKFSYSAGGDQAYAATSNFNLASVVLFNNTHTPPSNTLFFGNYGTIGEDFNGDGRTDLLRWADDASQNVLYLSNGDGSFTPAANFNLQGVRLFSDDGCYASIFRDLNGDGIIDIFRYAAPTGHYVARGNGSCTNSTNEPSYVFIGDGTGHFTRYPITGFTPLFANGDSPSLYTGYNTNLIDIDGDGLLDVVLSILPANNNSSQGAVGCGAGQTCTRVFRNTGTPGAYTEISTTSSGMNTYQAIAPLELGGKLFDVNADGLKDLWIRPPQRIWSDSVGIAISNGDGTFTSDPVGGCVNYDGVGGAVKLIDYNGDGRPDCFVAPKTTGLPITLSVYDIAGAAPAALANNNLPVWSSTDVAPGLAIIGDFNDDGRDDFILPAQGGSQPNALYLSNGDGTFTKSTSFDLGNLAIVTQYGPNMGYVQGDFRGNGNVEFIRAYNATTASPQNPSNALYVKTHPEHPDLLQTITTPTGAVYSINYVALTNPSSGAIGARYVTDRGTANAAAWPIVDAIAPLQVVATITADSGVGTATIQTEYRYTGLKVDALLGAPLGFREVRQQDVSPQGTPITQVTQYAMTRPYVGSVVGEARYNSSLTAISDTTRLQSKTNVYCDQTLDTSAATSAAQTLISCSSSAKLQRPYLLLATQSGTDLDGSALPTHTDQFTVNVDGEPLTTSTTVQANGATFTSVVTNSYQADNTSCSDILTCNWVIGKAARRTVHNTVPSSLLATTAGSMPLASATSGAATFVTLTSSVSFGSVTIGNAPVATQVATLSNQAGTAITFPIPSATSVSGADFGFVSTNCSGTLQSQQSCTIAVSFAPSAVAARSGTLTVSTSTGSVNAILSGTGAAPSLTYTPQHANWGTVGIASDSGDWPTITNTSTVPVLITAHSVVSGPAGVWSWQGVSGYCIPGTTVLSPGGTCKTFFGMGTLAAIGSFTAVDQVSFQASGVPSSTFTVQQTYTFATAATTATAVTLSFGNTAVNTTSAQQIFTVTNNATASPVNIGVSVVGNQPANFPMTNTCGSNLPAGASCTVTVSFNPTWIANGFSAAVQIATTYPRMSNGAVEAYYYAAPASSVVLSGNGLGVAAFTVVTPSGTTTTFTNPNAFAVTPTSSGVQYTAGFGGANVTSNSCTGSIAANGTCKIVFSAPTSDCKPDNYTVVAYVTDAGGTAYGTSVVRNSSRTICP